MVLDVSPYSPENIVYLPSSGEECRDFVENGIMRPQHTARRGSLQQHRIAWLQAVFMAHFDWNDDRPLFTYLYMYARLIMQTRQ